MREVETRDGRRTTQFAGMAVVQPEAVTESRTSMPGYNPATKSFDPSQLVCVMTDPCTYEGHTRETCPSHGEHEYTLEEIGHMFESASEHTRQPESEAAYTEGVYVAALEPQEEEQLAGHTSLDSDYPLDDVEDEDDDGQDAGGMFCLLLDDEQSAEESAPCEIPTEKPTQRPSPEQATANVYGAIPTETQRHLSKPLTPAALV